MSCWRFALVKRRRALAIVRAKTSIWTKIAAESTTFNSRNVHMDEIEGITLWITPRFQLAVTDKNHDPSCGSRFRVVNWVTTRLVTKVKQAV
jgi:hypothetical protein